MIHIRSQYLSIASFGCIEALEFLSVPRLFLHNPSPRHLVRSKNLEGRYDLVVLNTLCHMFSCERSRATYVILELIVERVLPGGRVGRVNDFLREHRRD